MGKKGSRSIFAFTEERVSLAQKDWCHILLKSSFCFMRCIAAGAWCLVLCSFVFYFLAVTGGIGSPNLECWCTLSPGWEVKRVGEESSVWGTGIIDYIGGSCWGNSMEISWRPAFLSALQLQAVTFTFAPSSDVASPP